MPMASADGLMKRHFSPFEDHCGWLLHRAADHLWHWNATASSHSRTLVRMQGTENNGNLYDCACLIFCIQARSESEQPAWLHVKKLANRLGSFSECLVLKPRLNRIEVASIGDFAPVIPRFEGRAHHPRNLPSPICLTLI